MTVNAEYFVVWVFHVMANTLSTYQVWLSIIGSIFDLPPTTHVQYIAIGFMLLFILDTSNYFTVLL